MSPRCDALRLAHYPSRQLRTSQSFLSTQGSVPVMIALFQEERSSLKSRLWTRECNGTKRKDVAATPRFYRVGTVGGLDRRLGDAGPVGRPFVCRSLGHAKCHDVIKGKTRTAIVIIFLAATLAALPRLGAAWGGEQPTSIQKHTQSMGEQIVGTWRLESIYEEDTRGEEISQFGVAPTGLFMADRHGNFSFQIMSIDGRRYAAKGLSSTSMGAGIVEAMHYFGTYAVNEQNHKLTLHVEYCLFRSCDKHRPNGRIENSWGYVGAHFSGRYPADWSILQSYGLEAGVLQMTHPPAGMPSWSRNARAILHTVHMGLWELLVAGAAFLFLLITHIIEDRAMAEVAQDENILAGKW